MNNLFRDSERVSPTGNIVSQGIINQLGRPSMDLLAVLVREAVQNSWDARVSDNEPVRFGISGWMVDKGIRQLLRNVVFADCPPSTCLPLREVLDSRDPLNVVVIYDRGTLGLGGPTRADIYTPDGEARDFVDFLRNIGQPPDKRLAGGTYGYGKAAFYRASRARTICVYTRCSYKGRLDSRFIASALGEAYEENKVKYTGRHWWGRRENGIAEPLIGEEADKLAVQLGLPSFQDGECGTTILVLQPNMNNGNQVAVQESDEFSPKEAFGLIAEHLLWYFWPKMLTFGNRPPAMAFTVSWQGEHISIPDPVTHPILQGFVQAMYHLKGQSGHVNNSFRRQVIPITARQPAKLLGTLSLQQFPIIKNSSASENLNENGTTFGNLTHHTVLMRMAELVVKYIPGTVLPTDQFGYAGVFMTDAAVDNIFASAEPPTHDNWVPDSLDGKNNRTFVRVALREIVKEMDTFAKPPAVKVGESVLTPLGAFATKLGNSLLVSESGPAATFKPFQNDVGEKYTPSKSVDDQIGGSMEQTTNAASLQSTPGIRDPDTLSSGSISEKETILQPPPIYTVSEPLVSDVQDVASIQKPRPTLGRARVKPLSDGDFVLVDGIPALKIEISIKHADNSPGTIVTVNPHAVIDGEQPETEPPIGASSSCVLRWIAPDGTHYNGSNDIFISSQINGNWFVIVSLPEDIMVGVNLRAEAKPFA